VAPHCAPTPLEADGIYGSVLYPTGGLLLFSVLDGELLSAVFRAYNDWIAKFCRACPRRLTDLYPQVCVRQSSVPDEFTVDSAMPGKPEDGPQFLSSRRRPGEGRDLSRDGHRPEPVLGPRKARTRGPV